MKFRDDILVSVGIGLSTALIVIISGYILDNLIAYKTASFIALILGLLYNFVLQDYFFNVGNNTYTSIVGKYLVVDIIILFINQSLMVYLIDNEHTFKPLLPEKLQHLYITIARCLVGLVVWICISFPLRKLWVYR